MRFLIVALSALCLGAIPAGADTAYKQRTERAFQKWIVDLWPDARREGISKAQFKAGFAGVKLDWSLPDLVLPGRPTARDKDKRQAEFGSPGRYFRERSIKALVAGAKRQHDKWAKTLARIERKYGVPGPIILAIWGRETSYGRVKIPKDAIRSLATHAFMGRRKEFFRPEVIAALKILEQGHISRKDMKSSWAGAMGQNQMMPTGFLRYAVDFDGDGRRDIWKSIPDTLATTANFLKQKGWRKNTPWGYEITLPAKVACSLEGPHRMQKIANWTKRGLTRTRDRKFPAHRLQSNGSLMLPAGRYGPAFIVTPNFYVLKEYNESDLYALMVGHIADRVNGGKPFAGKWSPVSTYTRAKVKRLQRVLRREGHNIGDTIDGLIGFRTRVAVGLYQQKYGLKVDCWPGREVFSRAR